MNAPWDDPDAELVLRFLKHRWLRDVAEVWEAGDEDAFPFEDLDLDKDLMELGRVSGTGHLSTLASAFLETEGALPDGRALSSLAPEFEGAAAQWFVRLIGINVAFRLRTDALLGSLLSFAAHCRPPIDPARIGALLARARSARDARALIQASPLADEAKAAALAAATPPTGLRLDGARLHVEGDHEVAQGLLERALRPATSLPWTQATTNPSARRFLLLRRRGGWTTVTEEGDRPPVELAVALSRAGAKRVAWASFGGEGDPGLRVIEGTRTVLDMDRLRERCAGDVCEDDVTGALRALGILDLDPAHPRGVARLAFAGNVDKDMRKRSVTPLAFA